MRIDILSIVGLLLALVAILGGNIIEGGSIGSLLNAPAALIVLGGTLAAAIIHTSFKSVMRAAKIVRWVVTPPTLDVEGAINKMLNWSMTARKEGLLGLEPIVDTEREYFARKGLRLLVDGTEPDAIRRIMEVDLLVQEQRDVQGARFFECMGGYSPTIGIIGAVMGLIQVMRNLADPSQLGAGIATAFVATIYGVGLANLMFLPMAAKLKGVIQEHYNYREMIIEGVIAIAEGENPRAIEMKLNGYLDDQ